MRIHIRIDRCNHVTCVALALASLAACSGTIACDQTLWLPSRGTAAAAIEDRFGRATVVETELQEVERRVRALQECAEGDVQKVASVWQYISHGRNTLFVAFDRDLRVVCAGHRGTAYFVQ